MSGEDEAVSGPRQPSARSQQGLSPPAGAGPGQQGPRHQHRPHGAPAQQQERGHQLPRRGGEGGQPCQHPRLLDGFQSP